MDTPLPLPSRIDALPEYTDYRDTGCDLYPSCLRCPLPKCRYEDPGGAAAMLRSGRDASIVRMADESGMTVGRLAEMFGLPPHHLPRPPRPPRSSAARTLSPPTTTSHRWQPRPGRSRARQQAAVGGRRATPRSATRAY